jgi:hypothetical protein
MPKGVPTPEQIVDDEVTFFSLDTDVIQAAGYNFEKGALNQLPRQLPRSMELQLTEVVLKEIVNHRLEPVKEALSKFQSSSTALQRLTALDFAPVSAHVEQLNVLTAAEQKFDGEVRNYVAQCRGEVLLLSDVSAALLFEKYFSAKPPFGLKSDKKAEFPDAAALLLLEKLAKDLETKAVVASMDGGWKSFAEQSKHLYCVDSIDELAALFAATDAHAQAVKSKITAVVNDENSALRKRLTQEFEIHISNADWETDELYSSHRIEAETNSAMLTNYSVDDGSLSVWKVDGEPGAWVVELTATVEAEVAVGVQFFAWDSIDREEIRLGSEQFTFATQVEVEAYLKCYEVKLDAAPETWDIDVEIGSASYSLDAAEIEPDWEGED